MYKKCLSIIMAMILVIMTFLGNVTVDVFAEGETLSISVSGTNVGENGNVVVSYVLTRSSSTTSQTYSYKTMNGSAIGGIHFDSVDGTVAFAKGESSKTITVNEKYGEAITRIVDRYQSSARCYYLKAWSGDNKCFYKRTIDITDKYKKYCIEKNGFSIAPANPSGKTDIDDIWDEQISVILKDYSSYDYLAAIGIENYLYNVSFEAKEIDDGYQYIQIYDVYYNSAGYCNNGNGDPGLLGDAAYIAGFTHKDGSKSTTWAKYRFPVRNGGNGYVSNAWNSNSYWNEGNSLGVLKKQIYDTDRKTADGAYLIVPLTKD